MLYQLRARQKLNTDIETIWGFLSDPRNLGQITPKMEFKILSGIEQPMFAGQIIHYVVAPFPGVRTKWVTEITHVKDKNYFVDEQRFGPYSLWHHKHFVSEVQGGITMEDIIDYKLPMGALGRLLHAIMIRKKLLHIFNYRAQKLNELFKGSDTENTTIVINKIH